MTKLSMLAVCICFTSLINGQVFAQAFKKGSLLISLSEGATFAKYTTANTNTNDGEIINHNTNGDRDPLTVEYGLSNHWGIGLNMGGDILHVDPNKFYGIKSDGKKVDVFMSEFTVDANYHYFVTKRTDISAFASAGLSDVSFEGKEGDAPYMYKASGAILRMGTKIKYYVYKRIGVMAMVSTYTANCSTKDVKENTIAAGYDTRIKGFAVEFGICTRLLK